jgi:amino acid transporter
MGRDGVFPRGLGRVHGSHDSPYVASLLTSAFAAAFLLVLVVSDVDSTTLYAKMGGIAVYLLIALFLITSIAIPAYFWARRDAERSMWKTIVAPSLGGAGFMTALVLATENAAFLVGGSKFSAVTLVTSFAGATLVAGVLLALVLRRTRPDVYARLGRQDV